MVRTLVFETSNPGSIPGDTIFFSINWLRDVFILIGVALQITQKNLMDLENCDT